MSFEMFFKQNAIEKENEKVEVSKRFKDAEGNVVRFEIKAITAGDDQILKDQCTSLKQLPGKHGQFLPQLDSNKYLTMLAAASIVFPDLANAELQNSYGATNKVELLTKMLLPGEITDLMKAVQKINGFETMEELTEKAKN